MSETIKIFGEASREKAVKLVSGLSLEKKWSVTIKRTTKQRTNNQNSWMWLCHSMLAAETGHTVDDIHEIIMRKFLAPKMVEMEGVEYEVYSTKKLTTKEMGNFMDQYVAWSATDMGIIFPDPDDQGREYR